MEYKRIRKHRKLLKAGRWFNRNLHWLVVAWSWLVHHARVLARKLNRINPLRFLKKLDWYIIRKFIGTYFFAIALIISISIVFDFNENLAKFTQYHAPFRAIVVDYLLPLFSSHQNWRAILKLFPCLQPALASKGYCGLT